MRRFSGARLTAAGSVVACLLAVTAAIPASATSTSNSDPTNNSNPNNYLALGDSVPFGFNPLLATQPGVAPTSFVGYPQLASDLFRPRLKVVNASCPGETSTSLISGTRPDNGCQNFRQAIGAMHVSYQGSQLQYAEKYVAANRRTKLVSLMIGANDLFRLQDACVTTGGDVNACILKGLTTSLVPTLRANLTTIYTGLREAGFRGELVAVTYYSTNYADPVVTAAVLGLNAVLAGVTKAYGGEVADGFGAFARAAGPRGDPCAAGLLIHVSPTTCDVHPSPTGAALLASALSAAAER